MHIRKFTSFCEARVPIVYQKRLFDIQIIFKYLKIVLLPSITTVTVSGHRLLGLYFIRPLDVVHLQYQQYY